mgnify:CR=1 FL=1
MKVLLAQVNPIVGNLEYNRALICNTIEKYQDQVDLIIFPELVITGYPPQDLLLESRFIQSASDSLDAIVNVVKTCTIILGTIRSDGESLYNTASVIRESEIITFRDKTLLPTYDVFDEDRYFTSASENKPIDVQIGDRKVKIGIEICEDLWDSEYDQKITQDLSNDGAELIINVSASPFSLNRIDERIAIVSEKIKYLKKHFIYCNLIGAQDELIFDGGSFVMSQNASVVAIASQFEQEFLLFNLDDVQGINYIPMVEEEQIYHALTLGVKDYFQKTGFQDAVIGLSGGIDSALVAAIACNALGSDHVTGITMPSKYSSDHSIGDSEKLAFNLGLNFESITIEELNTDFLEALHPFFANTKSGLAEENLQARIRGNILMAVANKKNALVLNTGNKTETALGYCTMYGDMCGALGVISDLNKLQVYAVSKWINSHYHREVIPENTILKPPSAELRPNQVDPFDYDLISPLVDEIINNNRHLNSLVLEGYDEDIVKDILQKIRINEFKRRQAAPGLRISMKAFGVGRRYPIVNGFRNS